MHVARSIFRDGGVVLDALAVDHDVHVVRRAVDGLEPQVAALVGFEATGWRIDELTARGVMAVPLCGREVDDALRGGDALLVLVVLVGVEQVTQLAVVALCRDAVTGNHGDEFAVAGIFLILE